MKLPRYMALPEERFRAELEATLKYLQNRLAERDLADGLRQGIIARELWQWAAFLRDCVDRAQKPVVPGPKKGDSVDVVATAFPAATAGGQTGAGEQAP